MLEMNYGCGFSTVEPRDLRGNDTVLYVGVGGGLEALQFAYFTRRPGGVIAVDPVADMRQRARANFVEAARLNSWFHPDFVTLVDGRPWTCRSRPTRQACWPRTACSTSSLATTWCSSPGRGGARRNRVACSTSDPITPVPLPPAFAADARLCGPLPLWLPDADRLPGRLDQRRLRPNGGAGQGPLSRSVLLNIRPWPSRCCWRASRWRRTRCRTDRTGRRLHRTHGDLRGAGTELGRPRHPAAAGDADAGIGWRGGATGGAGDWRDGADVSCEGRGCC